MGEAEVAPRLQKLHAARASAAVKSSAPGHLGGRAAANVSHVAVTVSETAPPTQDTLQGSATAPERTSFELEGTDYEQLVAHVAASIIQQHWQRHRLAAKPPKVAAHGLSLRDKLSGQHVGSLTHASISSSAAPRAEAPKPYSSPQQPAKHSQGGTAASSPDEVDRLMARYRSREQSQQASDDKVARSTDVVRHAEGILQAAGMGPAPSHVGTSTQSAPTEQNECNKRGEGSSQHRYPDACSTSGEASVNTREQDITEEGAKHDTASTVRCTGQPGRPAAATTGLAPGSIGSCAMEDERDSRKFPNSHQDGHCHSLSAKHLVSAGHAHHIQEPPIAVPETRVALGKSQSSIRHQHGKATGQQLGSQNSDRHAWERYASEQAATTLVRGSAQLASFMQAVEVSAALLLHAAYLTCADCAPGHIRVYAQVEPGLAALHASQSEPFATESKLAPDPMPACQDSMALMRQATSARMQSQREARESMTSQKLHGILGFLDAVSHEVC
jgi:hypothetical protein